MWEHKNTFAIGGLENVGYIENSDILVVLSAQGIGIFDCEKGVKLYRSNSNYWDDFDQSNSVFKLNENEYKSNVQTYGLYGGDKLPKQSSDGSTVTLDLATRNISLQSNNGSPSIIVGNEGPCELRVFGFSSTGRTLIIGTSCEIVIWTKAAN